MPERNFYPFQIQKLNLNNLAVIEIVKPYIYDQLQVSNIQFLRILKLVNMTCCA